MKKRAVILVLAMLLLTGCGGIHTPARTAAIVDAVAEHYYEGQNDPAFEMLQKHIFESMLQGWVGAEVQNPQWKFDTFARYDILDAQMQSTLDGRQLYYCTYTADDNKCGYVVVEYHGDSLSRVSTAQTPQLFDLQARVDWFASWVDNLQVDGDVSYARRASLLQEDGQPKEVLIWADGGGNQFVQVFGDIVSGENEKE